jgi:hypothetical protein
VTIRLGVSGTSSLRRVARKLQGTGPVIKAEAAREIQRAAPPVLAAVQGKVRSARFPAVPSKGGGGSTGLRAHLADSTRTRPFGTGVRFVVADPRGQTMARYTDGAQGGTRWRHPVFGHTTRWVQQKSDPWFHVTIRDRRPVFAGAVERAVRKIVQRIGGN